MRLPAKPSVWSRLQARKLPTPCIVKHTDWSPTRLSRCRRGLSQAASSPLAASSRSVFATPDGWPPPARSQSATLMRTPWPSLSYVIQILGARPAFHLNDRALLNHVERNRPYARL